MKGKYLKNRERILLHLSKFKSDVDMFNAPFYITQDGVAEVIGIGRNNIPREMKKLIEEGLVESKKARVRGLKNRRAVYFLTSNGMIEAKKIRESLQDIYVNVISFSGEKKTVLLREVPRLYGIDFITAAINLDKELNLDLVRIMRKNGRRVHYIEENFTVKRFYGRKRELKIIKEWMNSNKKILVVNGLPGMGKTTLILKFVKEHLKERDVLFIRLSKYKELVDILHQFAEFFSKMGNPKLEKYLRTHGKSVDFEINLNNAMMIIKDSCTDAVMIFDNIEEAQPRVRTFIQTLLDNVEDKRCKIILVGVGAEGIIRPSQLGKVQEIYISELSEEDALSMLRDEGVPEKVAFQIISEYGGIPLILELAKANDHKMIREFLFRGILNNMSPEERRAVEFASVFRREFKMNALLLNNVEYPIIYSLINKNILREMEYEVFSLHRLLRNFIYNRLPESNKKNYHLLAARYFLEEGDILEAVYHYTRGGKYLRANMLLAENYERYLFSRSGEVRQLAMDILNSYAEVSEDHEWLLYGVIGDTYKVSGEWDKAIENYTKALKLSSGKDCDYMGMISWKIAEIYGKQSDVDAGIQTVHDALKCASRIVDKKVVARLHYILGNLELQQGDVDDAKEAFLKALEIGETAYNLEIIGFAHLGLGRVYKYVGDYENALDNFFKASRIFEEIDENPLWKFYATLNIGITYYEMYDRRAEKYLKEAIKMAEKIGDQWSIVSAYLNYANWLMYSNKYSQAEKYLKAAEKMAKSMNANERLFLVYIAWGFYHSSLEMIDDAVNYFNMAIDLASSMGNDALVSEAARYATSALQNYNLPELKKYEKIAKGEIKVVSLVRI